MGLSRGMVRLLALTCGVTIANVYYAQPLLHAIAADLGVGRSAAVLVVTATQGGFGAGLLLVVPLGDILARRPLLAGLLAADAVALACCALAPGLAALAGASATVGVASVVVQMLIPYGATLARDDDRARVISVLVGSLLFGILLSRTFAGLVASVLGWRGVYVVAAVLVAVLAVVVGAVLPSGGREVGVGYLAQMRAVARLALGEPVLRWRALTGSAQFAAFSCFWTTVTFVLTGRPYGFSQADVGLFALVGAAGAACALAVGPLLDRRPRLRTLITGVAIGVLLVSFAVLVLGVHGLVFLIVGALLMDAASQAVHVTNQAVIYDLVDSARSRITAVYMTTYFIGGAAGTTVGALAYAAGGWPAACGTAAAFSALSLLAWYVGRRPELTSTDRTPSDVRPEPGR